MEHNNQQFRRELLLYAVYCGLAVGIYIHFRLRFSWADFASIVALMYGGTLLALFYRYRTRLGRSVWGRVGMTALFGSFVVRGVLAGPRTNLSLHFYITFGIFLSVTLAAVLHDRALVRRLRQTR